MSGKLSKALARAFSLEESSPMEAVEAALIEALEAGGMGEEEQIGAMSARLRAAFMPEEPKDEEQSSEMAARLQQAQSEIAALQDDKVGALVEGLEEERAAEMRSHFSRLRGVAGFGLAYESLSREVKAFRAAGGAGAPTLPPAGSFGSVRTAKRPAAAAGSKEELEQKRLAFERRLLKAAKKMGLKPAADAGEDGKGAA